MNSAFSSVLLLLLVCNTQNKWLYCTLLTFKLIHVSDAHKCTWNYCLPWDSTRSPVQFKKQANSAVWNTEKRFESVYNNQFISSRSYKTRFGDACMSGMYVLCLRACKQALVYFFRPKKNLSNGETNKSRLFKKNQRSSKHQTPNKNRVCKCFFIRRRHITTMKNSSHTRTYTDRQTQLAEVLLFLLILQSLL